MKTSKLLLLIPTVWITAYCGGALANVNLGAAVNAATSVLWLLLLVIYIVHVWRNQSFVMTGAKRVLWTLGLLGFGPLTMPCYFAIHVLPEPPAS